MAPTPRSCDWRPRRRRTQIRCPLPSLVPDGESPMARMSFLALGFVLLAQGAPLGATQALPDDPAYHVRVFGVGDGLPISEVQGVVEGTDGYLYVATGRGLVRFDGETFEAVPTPGLSILRWMHRDRSGRIWLMSHGNRFGLLTSAGFRLLPPAPGYPHGPDPVQYGRLIRSLSETSDGSIWLGGYDGLLRIAGDSTPELNLFTSAHGLPSDTAVGVFEVDDGDPVVVTLHRLARLRGNGPDVRFEPFGPTCRTITDVRQVEGGLRLTCGEPGRPTSVLEYRDGTFRDYPYGSTPRELELAAGGGAPEEFEPQGFLFRSGTHLHTGLDWTALGREPAEGPVYGLDIVTRNGTRWLTGWTASDRRTTLVRIRDGRARQIRLDQEQPFLQISQLYEDREGSLWVATDRGLLQLTERPIQVLDDEHGLRHGFFMPVLEDRAGSFWVGSWGGGLHRLAEGRVARHLTDLDGLPSTNVRALFEAADGVLWAGTWRGLAAIRDDVVIGIHRADGEIRGMAQTADGRLWVAGADGLFRMEHAAAPLAVADTVARGTFWTLHLDREGGLWAGGEEGLVRVTGEETRRFGADEGLTTSFVVSVAEEPDGTLWFGTLQDGLFRYRDGRFTALTVDDGLPDSGPWSLVDDGVGFAWMTSNQGLMRVAWDRLHEVADARAAGRMVAPLQGTLFTEDDGLPSREFNRASPAGARLSDGRLAFNNMEGLVVVDPRRIPATPPPVAAVRSVSADGRAIPVAAGGRAELPAGTRHLVLDLAALTFVPGSRPVFRYRVDGFDPDWVEGGTVARASYTGLAPGRYEFQVEVAAQPGAWSEAAMVRFSVPPLVWQTWWFRLGGIGLVVAGLWGAHHLRMRRALEVAHLRTRIASDLHDDIGANLSSIAILSDMLRSEGRLDERDRRHLDRLGTAAVDTIEGLRDVIWLVDPRHDNLTDLIRKLREVAGALLASLEWEMTVSEPLPDRRLAPRVVRNTLLIYKEALHNAVRHGGAARVSIEIEGAGRLLRLAVIDDGRGFDEAAIRPGRGLSGMRRRAAEVAGRLEIEAAPGRGTRVAFEVEMA